MGRRARGLIPCPGQAGGLLEGVAYFVAMRTLSRFRDPAESPLHRVSIAPPTDTHPCERKALGVRIVRIVPIAALLLSGCGDVTRAPDGLPLDDARSAIVAREQIRSSQMIATADRAAPAPSRHRGYEDAE